MTKNADVYRKYKKEKSHKLMNGNNSIHSEYDENTGNIIITIVEDDIFLSYEFTHNGPLRTFLRDLRNLLNHRKADIVNNMKNINKGE